VLLTKRLLFIQINEMGKSYFNDSVTVSTWDERDVILEEGCSDNPGLLLVMQVTCFNS
jgi:hypothetical protein